MNTTAEIIRWFEGIDQQLHRPIEQAAMNWASEGATRDDMVVEYHMDPTRVALRVFGKIVVAMMAYFDKHNNRYVIVRLV